jgi:anti-sigma regulatory factor (Ser/Thr protein kinase)
MADMGAMRLELTASLAEVAVARRLVRDHLTDVPDSVSADAQLIASELVTNAIEHGDGGPVIVELEHRTSEVALRVESVGVAPAVGGAAAWDVAPAEQLTGRGLGIVRAVAERVEVHRTNGRLVIVARLTF